jgi:hypothetical protein
MSLHAVNQGIANFEMSSHGKMSAAFEADWDHGMEHGYMGWFFLDYKDFVPLPGSPVETETESSPTSPDLTVGSRQKDEDMRCSTRPPLGREPRNSPRCRPNHVRKGAGKDSKAKAPDEWDNYDYRICSPAFNRVVRLGYKGIVLEALCEVLDKVEDQAREDGILLTPRNRAARRRKPCAFHWFDENWSLVEKIYTTTVREVLGETSGLKRRGRRKKHR